MVEVRMEDKERERVDVYSGEYCMGIVGNKAKNGVETFCYGKLEIIEYAEAIGKALKDVFEYLASRDNDPGMTELAARAVFMENFYGTK